MSDFGNFEFHNFSSIFWVQNVIGITSSMFSVGENLKYGPGTHHRLRRPVSIGTGSSQLHPFKNEAVTVQNTLPFCFQGSPYHSAYFQYLFIIIYRVFILSDNYCLSLIILSRLTEPLFTCLADYWQEVIQNLSNRERTLYPFISSAGPIYVSN